MNSAPIPLVPARPRSDLDAERRFADLWTDAGDWIAGNYIQLLTAIGLGFLIFMLLVGLRRLGRRLCAGALDQLTIRALFGRVLDKTRIWFMIMVAAKLVSVYGLTPSALEGTIGFLFTVAIVLQVAIWAREAILGVIEYRTQTSEYANEAMGSAMTLIRVFVTLGVFAIALIVVLDNLGVNVTGLVAGLGIGGIAIGLAAQGIFEELFAALAIIFDKPFKKGDSIAYDETNATVEKIGLKTTRLRAFTGEEKIISNSNLLDKEISNMTRLERRRIKFPIGVVYQTGPDAAARIPEILREVVEKEGAHFVRSGFVGFGASSLDFEIEFDVMNPDWEIVYLKRHEIGVAILKRFNEESLEFAYPTQTTFTAAPDGKMIMPYAEVKTAAESGR